jgi:RNA polymerase subunit RPABC4/transcription elongation factor Spt4
MSLVPCRACKHQVDTSAEACPGCGATNPGHKLSRQEHNLIVLIIQWTLAIVLLIGGGTLAWHSVGPMIIQQLNKPVQ